MKKSIIAIVTTVAVVSTVLMYGSMSDVQVQALAEPCITFTQNNKNLSTDCEGEANDLRVFFLGKGQIAFTRDGKSIGLSTAPDGANDLRAEWKSGVLTKFVWTRDGKDMQNVPVPKDKDKKPANDLKFITDGLIVGCFWTKDGKFLRYCLLPRELANDFKFVVPESSIGIIAMVATPLALLGYWRMRGMIQKYK